MTTWQHSEAERTEKITLNLGVVDLGQIDLLVADGLFSNRSDFLKDAVRRALELHRPLISERVARDAYYVGIQRITRAALEETIKRGEQLSLKGVGAVVFTGDVTPDLVRLAFDQIQVWGVVRGTPEVRAAVEGLRQPSGRSDGTPDRKGAPVRKRRERR